MSVITKNKPDPEEEYESEAFHEHVHRLHGRLEDVINAYIGEHDLAEKMSDEELAHLMFHVLVIIITGFPPLREAAEEKDIERVDEILDTMTNEVKELYEITKGKDDE